MTNTKQSLKKYPDSEQMEFIELLQRDYPNINFSDNCVGILDTSELCLSAEEILKHILVSYGTCDENNFHCYTFQNKLILITGE